VIVEAIRHLEEPERVVIEGESQVVEWNNKRFLIVYADGTRGGGRGIVVAGSKRYEIYLSGNERDAETLEKLAGEIEKLAKRENVDRYLFVIDGGKWLASFFMERFDEGAVHVGYAKKIKREKKKCVIVEHSHITWWEVCVIYKHAGEWFTIRLRDDFFVDEKRSNPEIDIPPNYIEVWQEAKEMALREFDKKPKAKEEKKIARKKHPKKLRRSRRKVKLIYRGPLSGAPEHAKNIMSLLRKVFGRKHVSSNKAEGLIGIYIHSARSCRGSGKILLKLEFQRKHVADAFEYLSSRLRFGRGPRGNGPRLHVGREYLIRYRDLRGKISEKRIRVLAIQKRHIVAYCYLREDVRKFRKKGILSVFCCQTT